jgi:hypothetical protein
MRLLRCAWSAIAGCALLFAGSAHAVTLNFEEALYDNFVSLSVGAVTFTANPAGFGDYGTGFWTGADFVAGGALEVAPSGTVTVEFTLPITYLEFGAAIGDSGATLFDFATITAFDGDGLELFPTSIDEPQFGLGLGDAERRYTFLTGGVQRVVFSYDPFGASVLAVDNLVYQPVPEPASWLMILAGAALVMVRGMRRLRLAPENTNAAG